MSQAVHVFKKDLKKKKRQEKGTFLVVLWLGLGTFTAMIMGSIAVQGTKNNSELGSGENLIARVATL